MEKRAFGKTGLMVSPLGFGAGHIGGGDQDEAALDQLLNQALDLGINLIDTARGYGQSEERIGRFISHRRDEFILSSKCGYGIDGVADWTPECIARGVDDALRRLRTDRIDIMHLHSCPRHVLEHSGVVEALAAAKAAGKIRCMAYSGENDDLEFALQSGRFDSIQCSVNVCDQRGIDSYLPMATAQGLGIVAKRPLANAFWRYQERPHGNYAEEYWARAQAMGLAPAVGMDWTEFALRWGLSVPGVGSLIAGTANPGNLAYLVDRVRRGPLDPAEYLRARGLFAGNSESWRGEI